MTHERLDRRARRSQTPSGAVVLRVTGAGNATHFELVGDFPMATRLRGPAEEAFAALRRALGRQRRESA